MRAVDANEIAALDQELMAEGMPAEEGMEMCDLHSSVLGETLEEPPKRELLPGHPVDTFRRENEAAAAQRMRECRERACGAAGRALDEALRTEILTALDLRLVGTTAGEPAAAALEEMIRKEKSILLPMSLEALSFAQLRGLFGTLPMDLTFVPFPSGLSGPTGQNFMMLWSRR